MNEPFTQYQKEILVYHFINGDQKTIEKYEKEILEKKDPSLSFFFLKYITGANEKEHMKICSLLKNEAHEKPKDAYERVRINTSSCSN